MGEGLAAPSASCFLKPFSQPVDSVNIFTLGLKLPVLADPRGSA